MTTELIAILVAITIFLGAFSAILFWMSRSREDERLSAVIAEVAPDVTPDAKSGISKGVSSVAVVLKPFSGLLRGNEEELGVRLALAGIRHPSARDLFFAVRLLLPIIAIVIVTFTVEKDVPVYVLLAGSFCFFLPDLWLNYWVARRRTKISDGLPDAIDLLVICMEAGLGMDQALIRVGSELRLAYPDLSEELVSINREQRAGKPRVEAWRDMSERLDLPIVRQLVNMLVQTERFGTPIARSLGQFAQGLRQQRMQKAEEMAAKTTVKMIFPLVLFIFPSMFVVLLGPAMINIIRNLNIE